MKEQRNESSRRTEGAISNREKVHKKWLGTRCAYCSAPWPATLPTGRYPLRYIAGEDVIACARGFGCSARRPEETRLVEESRRTDREGWCQWEFRLRGRWLSLKELFAEAALSDVCASAVKQRLYDNWPIALVVAKHEDLMPWQQIKRDRWRCMHDRARHKAIQASKQSNDATMEESAA